VIGGLFSKNSTGQRFERSLVPALVAGVFIALATASLYKLHITSSSWYQALSGGGVLGLGSFLLAMLVFNGIVGRVNREGRQGPLAAKSLNFLGSLLLKMEYLRNGVVVGLIYGVAFWLDNLLSPQPAFPLFGGPAFGLVLGISTTILGVIFGDRENTVQPVEVLVWSWSNFRRGLANLKYLYYGVLLGAISGLMCGLVAALKTKPSAILPQGLVYGWSDLVSVGVSSWLFLALLQGVSGAVLDEHLRIVPNQGIRLSARNGLFMGITGVCVGGAFTFLAVLLRKILFNSSFVITTDYVREGLICALIVGLAGGLIAGLLNGWLAYIRHIVLRILLSLARVIPSNYPSFLDEATARILLRKVGGSYIFIHRLLLTYFAQVENPVSSQSIRRSQSK
jgi:hypothetical protein